MVFFAQFLHAGGRWVDFCNEAPFGFTSPNAPSHEDVLGSLLLSILCGDTHYAHVNNPHKLGRPSHVYHTYWIAHMRLCLDVEVRPGNQSSASQGISGLWELIDSLPSTQRPNALRGDCH